MINQEAQPSGSMEAFARAFSNLVKDATSHLATKDDLANMATKDDINKLSDRNRQGRANGSGRLQAHL